MPLECPVSAVSMLAPRPTAPSRKSILVLGASARAAACSAVRSGFQVSAIDFFADFDLVQTLGAERTRRGRTWHQFLELQRELAPGACVFTGGMENRFELVASLAREREVLGPSVESLRRVRHPQRLRRALLQQGWKYPDINRSLSEVRRSRHAWLDKAIHASGGRGVLWADPDQPKQGPGRYFQRWVPGLSVSANFLAERNRTLYLGLTRQWTRRDESPPLREGPDFQYLGSLLGIDSPMLLGGVPAANRLQALGEFVARSFEMRGLFGIDGILSHDEQGDVDFVVLEVNPRYTASMELLEACWNFPVIEAHVAACQSFLPAERDALRKTAGSPIDVVPLERPVRVFAKAIVFAADNVEISSEYLARVAAKNSETSWPTVADIPHPNTWIRRGQPVVTVFASGDTVEEVEQRLGLRGGVGLLQAWQPRDL